MESRGDALIARPNSGCERGEAGNGAVSGRGGEEEEEGGEKRKEREIRRAIKILHSIPYIHNIYVFRLYPLHRSNINNILLFHSYRFKYISIFVSRINKRGDGGGKRDEGSGMRVGVGLVVSPALHIFSRPCSSYSLALRYIPLRLSSSFKTIFFVNVITV